MESFHSVAIVGAGISGLYAAHLLKGRFPDLVVLEAQDRIGGRIKQVHGLAPWPVEAGPEFIHGRNCEVVRYLETQMGATFEEKEWPEWWYFNKEAGGQGLLHDEQVDDEVDKVHDLFGDCGDEPFPPPGQDMSAAEWMKQKGCTKRQIAVADACYANDFACNLEHLGVREMIEENRRWDSGESYLIYDGSTGAMVNHMADRIGRDRIRLNWHVAGIEYGNNGAVVKCRDGRSVRCGAVLVTVPISLLQRNVIAFSPPLPAAKQTAIQRIKMGNALKIIINFSRKFWPDNMYDVVCPGSFIPEFWMLTKTPTDPTAATPYTVVGFLAGDRTQAVASMGDTEAQRRFLEQLDAIFGKPEDPHPASSSVVKGVVHDWAKEPYALGAYTYPSLGAELGDRAALGAPVGRLFFAGEHCNESINPCMQGAMQTAERAAELMVAALAAPLRSRL
ncbi:hypothetical protein HYH03_011412 [Edaphochlamys debaryana]|uniref:Amine oxidase domain-containing protein n=1 Tax=Edaphochlamys debaryana TaxID=47281 RepID=A0A836BUZ8_9CHLO|nr:hypothetical protein HYH03_011412 [Edaphochlamys debaryana]|eukprot:KAG2490106.1 hypothetical protein HYH03_011412 [Edaphochlamys debaryana]